MGQVEFANGTIDKGAYFKSFGNLSSGSIYHDPFNTQHGQVSATPETKSQYDNVRKGIANHLINARPDLKSKFNAETKSFGTGLGGTGSTDQTMVPFYLQRDIVDTSRRQTPLRAMIRRVTEQSIKAVFNVITGKSTASFQGEFEPQVVSDFTPERKDEDVKIIRVSGYTSGFAQESVPSFNLTDIQGTSSEFGEFTGSTGSTGMDINVLQATRAIQEFEEDKILNGDSSSDSKAFDGIVTKLSGNSNEVDKSSTAITLNDLDTLYFNCYGNSGQPNLAVCDVETYKKVKQLLQDKGGFLEYQDLGAYGFKGLMVKAGDTDIPLIPSRFLSTTAGSQSLYMLDLSVWEMRVLLDMSYEPLAKVDDGNKFMIKMYETLIDKSDGAFSGGIVNISN